MGKAQDHEQQKQAFEKLKNDLLSFDPIQWIEKYLTIDGDPFTLTSKGYKPLADIYRYLGVKALEPNSKGLIILKGRQLGMTTMCAALEMYFMGSGLFGVNGKPPIRIIHSFPYMELAAVYSKTKLQEMINKSVPSNLTDVKKSVKQKSHMQSLLDTSSPTNDSLSFKQFVNNNHLMIESVGLTGDRLMGRQLCLETDVPTLNGFVKLKDLKEGDKLFDEKGNVCNITKLHPINISPEAYKITFDDGSTVDACADHLWLTHTRQDRIASRKLRKGESKYVRVPKVKTTKEILNTLKAGGKKNPENNHSIPNSFPLNYPEKNLLLDPYLFGLWLGDGSQSGVIENADHEIFDKYDAHTLPNSIGRINSNNKFLPYRASKSYSYRIKGLTTKLGQLKQLQNTHNKIGDFYNKHIPEEYMRSSFAQRLALLQGLMDADGSCDKLGHCEFSQVREGLSFQVYELILSLGIKASIYKRKSLRYDVKYQDKFRIRFRTDLQVFGLQRKFKRLVKNTAKTSHRFIESVVSIPSKPMRCITVDSPSHLFLITKHFIPTHNTADIMLYDECFPRSQKIATNAGQLNIGKLYDDFKLGKELPLVLSYNQFKDLFEYKKITNAWKREKRKLVKLHLSVKKIECTPNHKFLTEFGWEEANKIVPGTLVVNHLDGDNFCKGGAKAVGCKSVNNDQYQILLGSFLGDGHLRNHGKSRVRMSLNHGIDQADYCAWKAGMFKVSTTIVEKNGYAQKQAITAKTKLIGLNKEFPQTKTICPQWILNEMDDRALAIWYMDDGNIVAEWGDHKSGRISTCSFDEDSQVRIVKALKGRGIDCHYSMYAGYYCIMLNKDGFAALSQKIAPYIHEHFNYKINKRDQGLNNYKWNNDYKNHNWLVLDKLSEVEEEKEVFDLEIEENHNFILASISRDCKNNSGPVAHNCQSTSETAISNSLKILTTSKYGNKGVQVFFGTPRGKGTPFQKRWQASTQQYYHLGCAECKNYFPLYTPGSDDWEKIWLHGYIVKCTHCGHEQDKRDAADRGKWFALKDEKDDDVKLVGFHINQLYIPFFTKEQVLSEKPGIHPTNNERAYQNEVLGEFFQGDSSPISIEDIRENAADFGRKMTASLDPSTNEIVVIGIDYGLRRDLEQMANPDKVKTTGQSYSTAVVLRAQGAGLLSIEFATKFKKNDIESKKGLIEQMMRNYNAKVVVADIGFSQDFSELMQTSHGDRYLVSRASGKINNHIKFDKVVFPKEIQFEKSHYIGEMFDQIKKGMIRFPFGDFEKIGWLVDHCASMDVKASISRSGDPSIQYVKGSSPNDGLMALINAYIGYKFIVTQEFTKNNGQIFGTVIKDLKKPMVLGGYVSRKI